jgi:hypothetical protein
MRKDRFCSLGMCIIMEMTAYLKKVGYSQFSVKVKHPWEVVPGRDGNKGPVVNESRDFWGH